MSANLLEAFCLAVTLFVAGLFVYLIFSPMI